MLTLKELIEQTANLSEAEKATCFIYVRNETNETLSEVHTSKLDNTNDLILLIE